MVIPVKPKTFIGSSREAIEYANAVHNQLKRLSHVNPWYAGVFGANQYTMESLETELDNNDFAVFIFAPDDVALYREKYVFITRDNTLFEMGLFWGRLRRKRVFALIPTDVQKRTDLIEGEPVKELHILSDLQGMTLLDYDYSQENKDAAVSTACQAIQKVIQQEGHFEDPLELLAIKEEELQQKQSILHFFWEYNKNVSVIEGEGRYNALSEAVRNSIIPPDRFRVTGAAFWKKQGIDGLAQVGGNVGKGRFFPFNANQNKADGDRLIYVLDVYFSGKFSFFKRQEVAQVYVLCYPLDQEHVLSVHFTGQKGLEESDLPDIITINAELLSVITHLVGGDSV
ncbi:TIR domain-containing protein [Paenibacillus terreus]|uniref:TIR domain-containing protein n=1 Tax=Paenibacillus terreus TaxID=1387834 RepID=A0ABV5B8Y8_9BACL